jgi:hypothetical protein
MYGWYGIAPTQPGKSSAATSRARHSDLFLKSALPC